MNQLSVLLKQNKEIYFFWKIHYFLFQNQFCIFLIKIFLLLNFIEWMNLWWIEISILKSLLNKVRKLYFLVLINLKVNLLWNISKNKKLKLIWLRNKLIKKMNMKMRMMFKMILMMIKVLKKNLMIKILLIIIKMIWMRMKMMIMILKEIKKKWRKKMARLNIVKMKKMKMMKIDKIIYKIKLNFFIKNFCSNIRNY